MVNTTPVHLYVAEGDTVRTVQEAWWTLRSVWVRLENTATTRVRTPLFLFRLRHQVEAARISGQRNMKVIRLSALRTGRLYLPGDIPGTGFCQRLSRLQGHSAAGRSKSMKNPNDSFGILIRDLPAYSAVPKPAEPPCNSVNSNA
jgi:hypothetical protein